MIDTDIVYAKVGNIHNCLRRIRDVTKLNADRLVNIDVQDIFVLNLQRAVQSSIDLAAHLVAGEGLGLPTSIRENFTLLQQGGILSPSLVSKMKRMVGFRNIAIHEYQNLDVDVLKSILTDHLQDLEEFTHVILVHYNL